MTIPASRRTKTTTEFFHQAYRLSDDITRLLIRDFGIKRVTKDITAISYTCKFEAEDKNIFLNLCNKYVINIESSYPLWIIEYYRAWILDLLKSMINNITQANTIYPTSEQEFYYRRNYQWQAIGNCYQLLQAFQAAIRILPVNVEKYMPFVERITNEIKLLKAWKKSDNKRLTAIQNAKNQI